MTAQKPKILLVETDGFMLRLYSRKFLAEGFIVQGVNTAASALQEIKNPLDIIMLEISLPDEDGLSVLKKIKRQKETAQVPVVILTNVSATPHREQAKIFGAAAYFIKAYFEPQEIINQIKLLLEAKKEK